MRENVTEEKEGKGRGKECEAPAQLIENSIFSHAAHITKIKTVAVETQLRCMSIHLHIVAQKDMTSCWLIILS